MGGWMTTKTKDPFKTIQDFYECKKQKEIARERKARVKELERLKRKAEKERKEAEDRYGTLKISFPLKRCSV